MCIFCGTPIELPNVIGEVKKCRCGTRFFIEVGVLPELVEVICDYFDVQADEIDVSESEDRVVFRYKDREIIAVLVKESSDEESEDFGLHTWSLFERPSSS